MPHAPRRRSARGHRSRRVVRAPRRPSPAIARPVHRRRGLSVSRGMPEGVMRLGAASAGAAAWLGAALSSLCCLLPLAVIVLGLGSGAFMAVTMQYRWILIPAGVLGVTAGLVLYVRERRRCAALACRMAGSRITLALLIVATLVVATSIVLDRFPEMSSDLLVRLTDGGTHGSASGTKIDDMNG